MKRLNLIILSVLVLVGLSACDILENQEPRQSLPLDRLYSSTDDLETALTGAYDDMQNGDAMGSSLPLFGEIMGDNASWSGSFEQWNQIASHDMDFTNGQISNVWNQTYRTINSANLIIEAVENGNIDDDAFATAADRIKGEALFIRALLHFEAVRMWAKPWGYTSDNSHLGVPVLTSGTRSSEGFETPSRNTVGEVYNQVISDFEQAITLLSGYDLTNSARANQWNARAYLARVYLQQGAFEEVANLTQEVIQSNTYGLEEEPQDYFFAPNEEGSDESVFDIVHTQQDNPGVNNSLSTFYASTDIGGRGDIQVTTSFLNALDALTSDQAQSLPQNYSYKDLRHTELVYQDNATLKYEDGTNTSDNAPVIRYADILLMRAEALAETASGYPSSESSEAIDRLNEVHLRPIEVTNDQGESVNPSTWFAYEETDFSSNQELIEAIRAERRIELAFEGKRKHDFVRWNMDVISGTSGAVNSPSSNDVTWPIPESELDANASIQQNDGYGGS